MEKPRSTRERENLECIFKPGVSKRERPGETFPCLARKIAVTNYSERRKFRRSCCWLGESKSKASSTKVASDPLLW